MHKKVKIFHSDLFDLNEIQAEINVFLENKTLISLVQTQLYRPQTGVIFTLVYCANKEE